MRPTIVSDHSCFDSSLISGSSDNLLDAYLKSKERIEYSPAAPLPEGTGLTDLEVRWGSLAELAGANAYYIFRLSEAEVW